jgi:hypothetical protein
MQEKSFSLVQNVLFMHGNKTKAMKQVLVYHVVYHHKNPFDNVVIFSKRRWKRSFFISLIFGFPVMAIMIYHMIEMKIHGKRPLNLLLPGLSLENLLYFILCTPVQVCSK